MKLRLISITLTISLAVTIFSVFGEDVEPDPSGEDESTTTTQATTTQATTTQATTTQATTTKATTTPRRPRAVPTSATTVKSTVDARNLVETTETSEPMPPDYCGLPFEPGLCKGYASRYYFYPNTGKCEIGSYGLCGGNANNFRDNETCMATCAGGRRAFPTLPTEPPSTTVAGLAPRCYLPRLSGTGGGRSAVVRYYFNPNMSLCQAFMWTGNGGNENNFASPDDCKATCAVRATTPRATTPTPLPIASGCTVCRIGRCDNSRDSDYQQSSSLLNIYLGLRSSCKGLVQSVEFIDWKPRPGKKTFLGIWEIWSNSASSPINEVTGELPSDLREIVVNLANVTEITTTGQTGWQTFTLAQPMQIDNGQFIGLHMESWESLETDYVVPYTTKIGMPTVTVKADQSSFPDMVPGQHKYVPLFDGKYQFSLEMRLPALRVTVEPRNDSPASNNIFRQG